MKNKKTILLYAMNALLLILIALCLFKIHSYGNVLLSQHAESSWKGDSKLRFAQVSCFFPVDKLTSTDSIRAFRKTIDSKLVDAGVEPKDDGQYWTDCYSATDSLTVKGDRNSTEATVIGVGGNFFLFHPYELLSGSYIAEDDLMKDRVVLDYDLAWKLFGGDNLAGMTVTINGKPYYVAGVVRRETDKFSDRAFSGEPVMFMSYDTLSALKPGKSDGTNTGTAAGAGIDCYEIAMPDPISNYAEAFVTESFKSAKGVVVENSARYKFSSIINMFRKFGSRSIYDSGVIYPYWENAARVSEVYVARLYVLILLLALFPLICLIVLAIRFIKKLVVKAKLMKFQVTDAWDDRYAREAAWKERRAKKHKTGKRRTVSGTVKEWKERLAKNRISRNIRTHEQKKLGSQPVKRDLMRKKSVRPNKKEAPKKLTEKTVESFEKEVVPDIESIVREVMEEMHSPDIKPK